jgi:hypothetical protein
LVKMRKILKRRCSRKVLRCCDVWESTLSEILKSLFDDLHGRMTRGPSLTLLFQWGSVAPLPEAARRSGASGYLASSGPLPSYSSGTITC